MSYQLGSVDSDGRADLYADPREDGARPRFRGLVASLVALVVIGVFAGGLWFAYQQGIKRGGVIPGAADVPGHPNAACIPINGYTLAPPLRRRRDSPCADTFSSLTTIRST